MAENARVPPAWLSTTRTGIDGPSAVAIGTTVACGLAGSSSTLPVRSSVSASATSAAQPSATVAARIERRSGSHTSGHSMAGPQCSRVRRPRSGSTSPAVATAVQSGTPVSSRRKTSALAASIRAA